MKSMSCKTKRIMLPGNILDEESKEKGATPSRREEGVGVLQRHSSALLSCHGQNGSFLDP